MAYRMRTPFPLAAAAALATLFAACTPGAPPTAGGPTTAPPPAASDRAVVIEMRSEGDVRAFAPEQVTIKPGTTVTWRHVSGSGHTATADPGKAQDPSHVALPPGAQPWDSGLLSSSQTFSHTFEVPGTYRYVCLPHAGRGMLGTITVAE